jgi:hypothetical protein
MKRQESKKVILLDLRKRLNAEGPYFIYFITYLQTKWIPHRSEEENSG